VASPRLLACRQFKACTNRRLISDRALECPLRVDSDGGFEPVIDTSGEEAVTLLREYKSSYRALVTDINLKGKMDGWEVAQHAREIEPEFPVVYMSGAAAADWTSKGVPNTIMLAKPFAPAQLLTAVSNLLNRD